jgi:hypothetical protein
MMNNNEVLLTMTVDPTTTTINGIADHIVVKELIAGVVPVLIMAKGKEATTGVAAPIVVKEVRAIVDPTATAVHMMAKEVINGQAIPIVVKVAKVVRVHIIPVPSITIIPIVDPTATIAHMIVKEVINGLESPQ